MLVLLHYKRDNLATFLDRLILLKKDYVQSKYSLEQDVSALLTESENFFKQIGQTTNESKVSTLSTYLQTALSGINPETLELVKTSKRKVIKSSIYHCLSMLSALLENEIMEIDETLERNKKMIEQIILSALQSKIITEVELNQLESIEAVEDFWNNLKSQLEQVDLIHKKLRLEILNQDIYILLDQIINRIKN